MVLCSFFPRADCGTGGLNAVLRIKVILLNPFPPVLRHFSKSCGGSARPFPWFELPYACARSFLMAFSCLLLYHALRSSAVAVCERSAFGPSGVQCQTNVLPSGNGRSISRGSVRRDRNTARTGRWRCERSGRRANGAEKAERMRPWKGSSEGGKPSGVRRCATFAEKLPVFLLFTGTFVPKLALFSSCCAFPRDKSRGSTDKRGRKRTRKRENVHSRRQKLVVSPFSCKFAAEIPAPHSHFSLARGGLQSTP